MDNFNRIKVAVLSINIGNYIKYWKDFYLSAMKNFLPKADKHFFVFTDKDAIDYQDSSNVTLIKQEDLGWPGNTLMRYRMFCRIIDELKKFDYVFFANANLLFFRPVGSEVLPRAELGETLVFVRRDNTYLRKSALPYEGNPLSKAFVNAEENTLYVRGGLNGGTSEAFIKMSLILRDNIDYDMENGIIAIWHDESHITRYAIDHIDEAKLLFPGYLYPYGWVMPYEKKILIRPKDNNEIRFGQKKSLLNRIKGKILLIAHNVTYSILIALRILPFEKESLDGR